MKAIKAIERAKKMNQKESDKYGLLSKKYCAYYSIIQNTFVVGGAELCFHDHYIDDYIYCSQRGLDINKI
jgi:hypothetical protein